MPARREAREAALKALYAVDIGGVGGGASLTGLWQLELDLDPEDAAGDTPAEPLSPAMMEFATSLVRGVLDEKADVDARIEAASTNWRLARMPVVDRNILRLGTFELVYRTDVPASVAINEAIELGKKYGGAETRAFVNGILDRIAAEVGRGGRRPRT
jgi:N utilization substance protein B